MVSLRYTVLTSCLLATSAMWGAATVRAAGFQAAVAEAQRTGKPILVLGTHPQCHGCELLKKRIANEEAVQELIKQYVVNEVVGMEDPDAAFILKRYRPKVIGTPLLIAIAPNGVQLFNQPGMPKDEGLLQLLQHGLDQYALLAGPRGNPNRGKAAPQAQDNADETTSDDAEPAAEAPKPKPKRPPVTPKSVASARDKAASYLAMAKNMKDPKLIKKYAEKAIAADPKSSHAEEAQKLIDGIK